MGIVDQYDESVVAGGFDALANEYGEVEFLRRSAAALLEHAAVSGVGAALDVATGPGTAALLLARRRAAARVVGIDTSPEMVSAAALRARAEQLSQAEFRVASATALPFGAAAFELVVCCSAIYYMPDIPQALGEWVRVLAPGGCLAFSTYAEGMLEPMTRLFDARVRAYGVIVPQPTPLYRLTQARACSQLLTAAGLREVRVEERQLGFTLPSVDAFWNMLMRTGFRIPVASLAPAARAEFEREYKRELLAELGAGELRVDVPAILASGRKA